MTLPRPPGLVPQPPLSEARLRVPQWPCGARDQGIRAVRTADTRPATAGGGWEPRGGSVQLTAAVTLLGELFLTLQPAGAMPHVTRQLQRKWGSFGGDPACAHPAGAPPAAAGPLLLGGAQSQVCARGSGTRRTSGVQGCESRSCPALKIGLNFIFSLFPALLRKSRYMLLCKFKVDTMSLLRLPSLIHFELVWVSGEDRACVLAFARGRPAFPAPSRPRGVSLTWSHLY